MSRPSAIFADRWLGKRFRRTRLRTQLLVIINASLLALMIGLVVADYRHSLQSRLNEKQVALSEEARTVASAVTALIARGNDAVQQFVDDTCALMNDQDSPGHSIEAWVGARYFFADPKEHPHHVSAPDHSAIAGAHEIGSVRARISEQRAPVINAARRAALGRIAAIALIGVVAALILNILVVRLVTRPLERLTREVRAIRRGEFGKHISVSANAEITCLSAEIAAMSAELNRREQDRKLQLGRARRLQSHLIGAPRREGTLEFAIEYHPADEVAGDLVDILTCPNGDILLCVADVVGHGIHAAVGSGVLKALLLSSEFEHSSPSAILDSINRRFCCASLPEDFASMIIVRVTHDGTRAVYASAGHEPGYIRKRNQSCRTLPSTGLLLGVLDESVYEDSEVALEGGDTVVLISDGISEAMDAEKRILGRQPIARAICAAATGDAHSVAMSVLHAARAHRGDIPPHDDETVLAFGTPVPHDQGPPENPLRVRRTTPTMQEDSDLQEYTV